MENVMLKYVIDAAVAFGPGGIAILIWYLSERSHHKSREQDREHFHKIELMINQSMTEMRQDYLNNASLVKRSQELQQQVLDVFEKNLAAQAMLAERLSRMTVCIENNLFCPLNRIEKAAKGPQS